MPICNYEGDVIGVAQIINKTNGEYFCDFLNIGVGKCRFVGESFLNCKC